MKTFLPSASAGNACLEKAYLTPQEIRVVYMNEKEKMVSRFQEQYI